MRACVVCLRCHGPFPPKFRLFRRSTESELLCKASLLSQIHVTRGVLRLWSGGLIYGYWTSGARNFSHVSTRISSDYWQTAYQIPCLCATATTKSRDCLAGDKNFNSASLRIFAADNFSFGQKFPENIKSWRAQNNETACDLSTAFCVLHQKMFFLRVVARKFVYVIKTFNFHLSVHLIRLNFSLNEADW